MSSCISAMHLVGFLVVASPSVSSSSYSFSNPKITPFRPLFVHSKRSKLRRPIINSSSSDDSVPVPKKTQSKHEDPQGELSGPQVELRPRTVISPAPKHRSWFGPNGQYVRELPCPSCRGRGYVPCTDCGIEKPQADCLQCSGKGLKTCHQCFGDCVTWEESIDEQPWEKAHSTSPFKVKEDEEVDSLEINLETRKKSKRVYQSPSREVGLKISRSLKSLNATTGLFSKRMKIIHGDPVLHAQRVAAIKKTKGTAAARIRASEAMTAFFRDPANRHKRSVAMQGVKFYCQNCGGEGHRMHYCPELKMTNRRFRCGLCGEKGHNRRTCRNSIDANSCRMHGENVDIGKACSHEAISALGDTDDVKDDVLPFASKKPSSRPGSEKDKNMIRLKQSKGVFKYNPESERME